MSMDQRVSNNHRDGGHGGDGDVVRGRHHGNHRGGGSGNNYLGGGGNGGQRQRGRDNDRGGNNDDGRHDRFHGSQQQHYQQHYLQNNPHQHQQMQLHHVHHNERRGGYGHKRSLSPPHSHHDNDLQQHQNQRPIKLHREGSGGPPPPPHTPQSNQQLLSPSSNQKQPPPLLQQTPVVPPEKRRTLILSNIPSHIQYYQLQNFFRKYWNAPTQYCVLDRNSCEAYVVFKFVEDAQRVWNGGGLDGNGGDAGDASNGQLLENNDNCVSSLVALGVELRAVHFSNHVELGSESSTGRGGDNPYNRGGYSEEIYEYEGGGVGRSNGGNSFNDRRRPGSVSRSVSDVHAYHEHAQDGYAPSTKQPRYSEGHHAMDSQQHNARPGPSHVSPASSAIQLTPAANPRIPVQSTYEQQQQKQQEIQLSPIELQMQQQQEAEEWAKWEAFQVQEMEWRKRRHAEYNSFTQTKNERSNQLSTLEQKRDLLSKQEHMLSQQLPLHKKMLAMLKSKNATPAEQTTKMKEILSTSKRIVELKTEMKGVIEDIEKMKEEEVILGVFRPSEKRPVFTGNVGAVERVGVAKKRSLDRRTTMLKVQGFNEAENADEDSIMKQFSAFGTVTSVRLEKSIGECGSGAGGDDATILVALIKYENRIDAERAKSEISKRNGSLTCTWHRPSSVSCASKSDAKITNSTETNETGADDDDDDEGFYDDVYDGGEDDEEAYYDDEPANGDYEGEEDFVDYD